MEGQDIIILIKCDYQYADDKIVFFSNMALERNVPDNFKSEKMAMNVADYVGKHERIRKKW